MTSLCQVLLCCILCCILCCKCYFISHVLQSNAGYGLKFGALVAFSFWSIFVWFYDKILLEKSLEKKCSNEFHALSKVWRVQRASNWCTSFELRNILSIVYGSSFWFKFWRWANFSFGYFARKCTKIGCLKTCGLLRRLFIRFCKQQKQTGLSDPTGLRGEAIQRFSIYAPW